MTSRITAPGGPLASDAPLAALAWEHSGVLWSIDSGVARSRGVVRHHPLG